MPCPYSHSPTYKTNATTVPLGGCDEVLQWGFDETTLDGTAARVSINGACCAPVITFFSHQPSRLSFSLHVFPMCVAGSTHSIITVECAGILPCSTVAETIGHIEKTWERGQVSLPTMCPHSVYHCVFISLPFLKALLELVRAELAPELRDLLVPLVNGGIKLHKISICNPLSLGNLSKLAQSLVNGTHRPASNGLAAGIALTADPRLRTIIGLLCRVQRKTVNPS